MDDVRKELVEEHRTTKPRLEKVGHHKTKRRRTEEALREKSRLKQLLLDTLPHPAMLIRKDRTVLAANRVAREVGAKVGGYCWRDFGQSDFIPEKHKKYINDHKKVPLGGTHCHFCLADEALRNQERTGNAEIHAWGKIWDAHWIPLDEEVYLHYAIDVTECKRAQEALRDSEDKYRAIFEQAADSIVLVDAETGELVEFNDKAHENLGYTREEFQKLKIPDFEIIKSAEEVTKHIKKIVGERADTFETKHRTKDGQIRDVLVSSKAISIGGKDLCQSVWHDITAHKKAKNALRRSEEHWRMLEETMNDGLGIIDEEDRHIYVNKKLGEILGYSPDKMVGKHCVTFYDEDGRKTIDKHLPKRRKGIAEPYEVATTRPDGKKVFVRISPQTILDKEGKYKGSFAVVTNITEHKKAQAEIKDLAKFPAENPDPVLRLSADGTVLYSNKAGLALLDSWKCAVGRRLSGYWHLLTTEALSDGFNRQIDAECGDRVFLFTFAPVVDFDYVNVYAHDITERKRAELELFRRRAQLKSLASQLTLTEERERRRIATELHDQVSQSLTFSKMKLDELLASQCCAEAKQVLGEVCDQLGQAIENTASLTFDLSPPTLGELGFEQAVAEWLDEQVQQKHGVACEFEDDGQLKPLEDGISMLLFRDVRELLTNVVKHAQAQKVKVSIYKVDSRVVVSVEDDGRGFDPEKMAATGVKKGRFGLFSIRERLEELGGRLEIDSAPGSGTKVTITAPPRETSSANEG